MKKTAISTIQALIIVFLSCIFVSKSAIAAQASISATPLSGEYELAFRANPGEIVNPEEIRIRMLNTNFKYEIRQELLTPLSSGINEINWRNLMIRGLRGSNASGTFHAASDAPMPVNAYSSLYTNTAGTQDEFILIYNLNVPSDTPAGSYRGRIRFVLMPLEAGYEQASVFLNIVTEVGRGVSTGASKPTVEITPLSGLNVILLDSKRIDGQEFDMGVSLNKNFDNLFSIVQIITDPLVSGEGNQFDHKRINFKTIDVNKGVGILSSALSNQRQIVYTSRPNGEADTGFIINYSLGDLSGQKAGKYNSVIQYYLEEAGKQMLLLKRIGLEINIERIFDLELTPEDPSGLISFRDLSPKDPARTNEVIIEIKSNVGKKYQVSQNVCCELSDKSGDTIPFKYFTLATQDIETKGILKFPQKTEVKKGDTIVFISDSKGSPDKFKLIYGLTCPLDIRVGDYSTRITYSLIEI